METAAFVLVIAAAMVALYWIAERGHRRRSLIVGIVLTLVLIAIAATFADRDGSAAEAALTLVLGFAALAAGDAMRLRRELRAQEDETRRRDDDRRIANERLRIARDLHDSVAHALVAINVRAGITAHLTEGDPAPARQALEDIQGASAEALEDLRATLGLLREADEPAPTSPGPDLNGLDHLFDRARSAGLSTRTRVELGDRPLPAAVQQAGYRIVQEALTNVMRHASATEASVVVSIEADALAIDVADDGTVAAEGRGASAEGHGLRGMAERAAALGGEVRAGPVAAGGWRVRARLPLARERSL